MQLTYISASSIPSLTANSIHVMKMCQAMVQEGHSVELLAPLWQRNPPEVNDDLWLHYGISVHFPIIWIPARGWFRKRTYHLRSALGARTSRTDLVYTRHLGAAAVSSLLGVPTIYEAHDLPGGKMGSTYFRAFLAGRGFRRLVVISQPLQGLLYQRYSSMLGKQVIVAHDGVDLERFQGLPTLYKARRRLGLDPERFTVGYSGNLYAGRGIELILGLAKTFSQVEFVIIGGDETSVAKWRRQAELFSSSNIEFKGFVSNAELPLYEAACEVLLMPYQRKVAISGGGGDTSDFCSPMKMFEYMATGRMIISSDLPVLREVLNGDNAALCDPEDITTWKTALERAIADPEWRQRLGQQAKREVEQYSWRRRVHRVFAGLDV